MLSHCSNYVEARVCWAPHFFHYLRAHVVAENLGTEGPPHLFFCNLITTASRYRKLINLNDIS